MGGKRQANILSSVIKNFDTVEEVIQTSSDSSGSALKENEKYLDSIQGKIDQFNNTLQTFWNKTISSDMVKGVVELGTNILKLVNNIGLIPTALAGVAFYFTAIKKNNPVTMFKDLSANVYNYGQALNQIKSIQSLNGANGTTVMDAEAFNSQHIQAYGLAVQGLTQKQQVAALVAAGLNEEQVAQAIGVRDLTDANFQAALAEAQVTAQKKNNIAVSGTLLLAEQKRNNISLSTTAQNWLEAHSEEEITKKLLAQAVAKGQLEHQDAAAILLSKKQTQANIQHAASLNSITASLKQMIAQNPVMFFTMIATAVSTLISKIETATDKTEKLTDAYNELQSSISSIEGEISSLDSELNTIQDKIDELNNKDSLSLADAEQLNLLKQQSAELQYQKELQENLLSARESQNQEKSLSMINNMIKTTAANQQKAAESGKEWVKWLGGAAVAILAVAGVLAAVPTGGLSLGATTISAGTLATGAGIAGATIGGAAGSKFGEWAGGQHNKSDSLIEWYESYEKAILEAEQEASEAESKYMSDMTEKNHEKWQKKVEYVNTLQTEMYDGLTELQGYISNLEYDDSTKDIIDGYNDLMAHIDVKSNGGNIDAQISSIESLKDEYYALSRGVDEHGNNIALTAEEYARYQSIVAQVLGYNVGLTESFTSNGHAIYDTEGKLIGYNSVLEETIKLLKEQQRLAAKEAIEGEYEDNSPLWKAYKNATKQYKKNNTVNYELAPDVINGWSAENNATVIENIIGKQRGVFDKLGVYAGLPTLIADYNSEIAANRDAILEATKQNMQTQGILDEEIASYMSQYTVWLDDAIGRYADANSKIATEFKETLYLVPQMSEAYNELTGSQLTFVNEYIASLKIADDMSKNQIVGLKQSILDLMDSVSADENLQTAIDDLITLDPSSMPVDAYRNKFNDLWSVVSESVSENRREDLLNQLFPDQDQIDAMIEAVQHELVTSSKGLVKNLNLEELRIAYKILPEYDNDYEEYRQIVAEREELASTLTDEQRYWGNVDEYARHVIVVTDNLIEELKTKKLIPDEWTKDNFDGYMTTFGMQSTISDNHLAGQVIMYTPILPNGEILDQDTIDAYIDTITKNTTNEAAVLKADAVGAMIGDQFVSGIINGVTNVDDNLINTILEPIFNDIDGADIVEYGENVNKIVSDQIVKSLDITDSDAVNEVSDVVSDVLTNAFSIEDPDMGITDVIDKYSMELITSAQAIKMSQDQHNVQADIYDKEYEALVNLNTEGLTYEQLLQKIAEHSNKVTGPIVQTYSTLTEQAEKLNEIITQTSEIVLDNTKVTQEYKESLVELGISEEELADCFDATNSLVVTNAKKLNELVKSTKKNTAQNAQLAKSQARLQYYELYKEMSKLVDANGKIKSDNVELILGYYKEMNALEKTIARYSMLEAQLLGAANAYEKFKEAQETDSETDYISGVEEMAVALGEAFNTAELGTETAQASIAGLVPESIYEDLDTVDEKMAAIYDYFKNGKLSQYLDITFDEDGNIEGAEMKLGNLRKFIEDGLGLFGDQNGDEVNPFAGTDWKHFELNQDWLDSLLEETDVLQALADQMNVTKDVAFAFVKSLEDHDIEWLNGDYYTFFDQMLASTNEGKMQLYTERLADCTAEKARLTAEEDKLTKQLNDGQITQEEYDAKIAELTKKQDAYNQKISEYNTELSKAKNASKQNIFGVGAEGTQYAGQADYQLKTSSEIEATDNVDDLDNWIERNEKVKQLYAEQEEAQKNYTTALEEYNAAVEKHGGDKSKANKEFDNLKEAEQAYTDITAKTAEAIKKRDELAEPTVLEIEVAIDEVEAKIESTKKTLDDKLFSGSYTITVEVDGKKIQQDVTSTEQLLDACFHIDEDGYWTINAGVDKSELAQKYPEILSYVDLLNSNTTLTSHLNADDVEITLETLSGQIEEIITLFDGIKISLDEQSKITFENDVRSLLDSLGPLGRVIKIGYNWITGEYSGKDGAASVNGTAHASGTVRTGKAHKSGYWGLPTNEQDSLVGELGPELVVDPSSGRYYTVGDNGAEMVDLKRGSIIFNHEQTKGLLEHGHIASRGKAYAEGNAHLTIYPDASSKSQWEGTGYSGPDDPTWDASEALSDALSDAADSVNEFEETIDWIEIRMEEFDERIGKLNAEIENLTTYTAKNAHIDKIIAENQKKYADSLAGAKYYEEYAQKYLSGMNDDLIAAAKNGAIAITEFTKEQDEATVKAIQNYRDYAQKASGLYQQAEEILTEIRDSVIQKIDNIQSYGDAKVSIEDLQTEKLQNRVDLDEESGLITSSKYYTAMMENSSKKIEYWTPLLKDMQKEFDDAVENGQIPVGSIDWYEQLAKLYDVQAEIDSATIELEEFQNAINDIYWDNFDELINRLGYLKDETQNLIDLMDNEKMVVTPETDDGWSADQVEWTKEGLATMGLYAQQMEFAEYTSKQYAEAIDDLTADYKKGLYSENEYLEKLNELKQGQYDSIEAYYDAKDAIVELNKARVDEIKNGIEKEIKAYEKLISKKKEELSTEKDLYDFQKKTQESSKNIAEIQRKLAALSADNSASAIAQRKKLEAELAEAKADQEEMYYERSIDNQQNALDKELEDFQEQKDKELEQWDKYLENVEALVTESLGIVQANATEIGATLTGKAEEYNLTVSDAILSPWADGALAVSDYQGTFDTSMSSTMDQLNALKNKWQEVIDKMAEAGRIDVSNINAENASYAAAEKTPEPTPAPSNNNKSESNNTAKAAPSVGSTVTVKKSATNFGSKSGSVKMASFVPGGSYTVYQTSGSGNNMQVLIGKNGAYTGWVKLTDLNGYAKGTTGVDKDQWAWLDELGEELVLNAGPDGRLQYLSKGSSVLTHDLTERLMDLAMNPQEVLDRNRPQITPSKSVINTEINLDCSVGTLVNIEHCDQSTLPDVEKIVNKAFDKHMQNLNNSLKRFTR